MTNDQRAMWKQDGTLNHIGAPSWLTDDSLQTLMCAFEDAGFQIYAVGGCVRDTVIQREQMQRFLAEDPLDGAGFENLKDTPGGGYLSSVHDIDLSTDATPAETTRIIESLTFRGKPWKAVPTGIDHGTVTAVAAGGTFEITTFRKDVETDGRHAVVAFSRDIEDDAMRRDFTINAFYADRTGRVRDIVGGSSDLRMRRVRFIGDPMARIKEDYLRILRFFRFTASHGNRDDGIDADGLAACASLADGLAGISRERIGAEFKRIIMDFDAAPIVGTMEQSGVLLHILPGASVLTLARLIDLEESYPIEGRMLPPSDLATRLAALGCDDVADRLRLSKEQAAKVDLVRTQAGETTPPHELGYRFGHWPAVHCMLLRWTSLLQPFDETVLADIALGAGATCPVIAADVMPEFTGKALGDRLRKIEQAWIASKFELSKKALLALP